MLHRCAGSGAGTEQVIVMKVHNSRDSRDFIEVRCMCEAQHLHITCDGLCPSESTR